MTDNLFKVEPLQPQLGSFDLLKFPTVIPKTLLDDMVRLKNVSDQFTAANAALGAHGAIIRWEAQTNCLVAYWTCDGRSTLDLKEEIPGVYFEVKDGIPSARLVRDPSIPREAFTIQGRRVEDLNSEGVWIDVMNAYHSSVEYAAMIMNSFSLPAARPGELETLALEQKSDGVHWTVAARNFDFLHDGAIKVHSEMYKIANRELGPFVDEVCPLEKKPNVILKLIVNNSPNERMREEIVVDARNGVIGGCGRATGKDISCSVELSCWGN